MSRGAVIEPCTLQPWRRRVIAWGGALLILAIVALAAWDIARGYRASVEDTGRELQSQAHVIAEQTARSIQAVDVVLRHVAGEYRRGRLARLGPEELHTYLRELAVGLVQIGGFGLYDADGNALAQSWVEAGRLQNIAEMPGFKALRDDPTIAFGIANAMRNADNGRWILPLGRRLETPSGEFAGIVGAIGNIDYFQDFYRDVKLDPGASIALLSRGGTLLARFPSMDDALGRRFVLPARLAGPNAAQGPGGATRIVSSIDGVERYSVLLPVPGLPLDVMVGRDVEAALAPWHAQMQRTIATTLALALLASLLLAVVWRQFQRLYAVHRSLEASRERFELAAAGSDDGIWDWELASNRVYLSARARELFGACDGPDSVSKNEWFAGCALHPDDAQLRNAAIDAHLAGLTPAYLGEYRVRNPDGSYRWIRVRGLCVRDAKGYALRMAGSVNDIDARKRVQEALRESEERYALAVAGSDDGVWDWDFVTNQAFESARARELQGLPPGPDLQPLPDLLESLRVHPDDAPRRAEAIRAHLAGETPAYECEYRVCHDDGTQRWIRVRALCIRDAAGKPIRMAGSVSDIDARRRTEESLRQSEQRYALAMAGSSGGYWVWDVGSDALYASGTLNQLFGLPADQQVTTRRRYFAQVKVHPHDWPRVRQIGENFTAGTLPRADFEYRIVLPDSGEVRWIMTRAQCFHDAAGKAISVAGVSIDVTDRKRMEEALRKSEERYQLAVTGSNEGLWDWDLDSDTLFLSARAQEFMGLTPSEPVRPRREWIARSPFHPDDRERVRQVISAHLRGETEHYSVEYRLRHAAGQWRWHRQRGVALRDGNGRPYRMAGSMEDVTERKEMEAERDRLQGQLLQAKKLEAIGTLAGGIAHDFNNILSAILGYGEMAQKDARPGSAQLRHIDAALSAGMRAKSLVERILAFSRSGMGERVPVHVQAVVREALDAVTASLPQGVHLVRELDADDGTVLGDPTQVHQVVMNLCANAVQAMKSHGTLTVTLDSIDGGCPQCATSTLTAGRHLRLSVRDTGAGIAPHLLERIFDPFFTTKDIGVGTGLGLSLVHGIVTDLGGGIDVQSALGEGSTFTVYLPWREGGVAPARIEEAVPDGTGETILLVDDEEALVRLGEELIAQLGYEPVGFTSGKAALAAFRATPDRFDAVLSDEAMPEMTGSEMARQVRTLRPDIPIVLMSGYVTTQLAARAREAGVAEVLAKPLVARDIARSLAAAVRGRRLASATRELA